MAVITNFTMLEREVRFFQQRILKLTFLKYLLLFSVCGSFGLGTVVIFLRLFYFPLMFLVWPVSVMALMVLIGLVWRLWRRRHSGLADCAAELERFNGGGGVIAACWETGQLIGLVQVLQPPLRFAARKPLWWAVAGLIFLIGAYWLPVQGAQAQIFQNLDISQPLAAIQEDLDELKESGLVSDEEVAVFEEKMEEVLNYADSLSPAETMEALDYLEEALALNQTVAAQEAMVALEQLNMGQALGEQLLSRLSEGTMDPSDGAFQEFSELMQQMTATKAGDLASGQSAEALQRALQDGAVSAQELAQILKEMGLSAEEMRQLAENLSRQSSASPSTAATGKKQSISREQLKEFLKQMAAPQAGGQCGQSGEGGQSGENGQAGVAGAASADGFAALRMMVGQRAGAGGISRGPGHVPIQWQTPVKDEGFKFKPLELPQSQVSDTAAGELMGISTSAPELTWEPRNAVNALSDLESRGGEVRHYQPLPQHRDAVKKYLEQRKNDE